METPDKGELSPKLLLDFLSQESAGHELPQGLWHELEQRLGDQIYSEILFILTQMHFEPDKARSHWQEILSHRESLGQILGRDVGLRVALADYFVNVQPIVKNPILVDLNVFLQKEDSALRDELTGLYNRRFFNRVLHHEIERSRRFGGSVSMLMVDVDHFKHFNDSYGHIAGDRALYELAEVLRRTSRVIDHLTRYGGEEFALILPQADRDQAVCAAERHRLAVERHPMLGQDDRNLTISIGAATFPMDASSGHQLLEKADDSLYQAKRRGRNRVCACFPDKRRHPRFPVELGMGLRTAEDMASFIPAHARNISAGGLLGEAAENVPRGRRLEMKLLSSDSHHGLTIRGRCVRAIKDPADDRTYFLGVSFDFDSPEEERALNALIEDYVSTLH